MTTVNHNPQDLLPLSENVWHILMVLGDGQPWHGYAINKQVQRDTEGKIKFGAATLYRTIRNMLEQGLIEEVPRPANEPSTDERRRYYHISGLGQRTVKAQIAWFNERVRAAQQKPVFGAGVVLGGV